MFSFQSEEGGKIDGSQCATWELILEKICTVVDAERQILILFAL